MIAYRFDIEKIIIEHELPDLSMGISTRRHLLFSMVTHEGDAFFSDFVNYILVVSLETVADTRDFGFPLRMEAPDLKKSLLNHVPGHQCLGRTPWLLDVRATFATS